MSSRWVLPLGSAEREDWAVVVDESVDGWTYTGLYAGSLLPGEERGLSTGTRELIVVPLSGSVDVQCTDSTGTTSRVLLAGQSSVFDGPTDVAFVLGTATSPSRRPSPAGWLSPSRWSPTGLWVGCRPSSTSPPPTSRRAARRRPGLPRGPELRCPRRPRRGGAHRLRGHHPGGNWSSYPPHKHDTRREGVESQLEEIYYHEVQASADAPEGADPMAYLRVYGTVDREIDVLAEVRSGDVVLVPHGWHGPAMAVPGYDLYYLNVMAGPGPSAPG